MPHVHEQYDFVVSVYIVCRGRVLLVDHKSLGFWTPIGGHVELDEDPEQALMREIREESGLDNVAIVGKKPPSRRKGWKPLFAPAFLDVHNISESHRHINLSYIGISEHDRVQLSAGEHHAIRWFSHQELNNNEFKIPEDVQFYAGEALKRVRKYHAESRES